jgi:ubiquinone/menaquinone biosynthesis C-methylase UbiE
VTTDGRSYWERHAKRYDTSTRFLSRPVPRMLELAVEAARGKTRVLEVAAGTGPITTAIAPVVGELIATDYAAAMVQQLDARVRDAGLANVTCEQADIRELRFDDASFDAVFAANVLHLVRDLEGALASLRRVLKPGSAGRAEIATDPMGVEISDVFVMLKPHDQWQTAGDREQLVITSKAAGGSRSSSTCAVAISRRSSRRPGKRCSPPTWSPAGYFVDWGGQFENLAAASKRC